MRRGPVWMALVLTGYVELWLLWETVWFNRWREFPAVAIGFILYLCGFFGLFALLVRRTRPPGHLMVRLVLPFALVAVVVPFAGDEWTRDARDALHGPVSGKTVGQTGWIDLAALTQRHDWAGHSEERSRRSKTITTIHRYAIPLVPEQGPITLWLCEQGDAPSDTSQPLVGRLWRHAWIGDSDWYYEYAMANAIEKNKLRTVDPEPQCVEPLDETFEDFKLWGAIKAGAYLGAIHLMLIIVLFPVFRNSPTTRTAAPDR